MIVSSTAMCLIGNPINPIVLELYSSYLCDEDGNVGKGEQERKILSVGVCWCHPCYLAVC